MKPVVIDFESEAINENSPTPPKPVGVALRAPGKAPRYFAWGHPAKNNCTFADAREQLRDIWRSGRAILCHNASFDLSIAEHYFDLRVPNWERIHDTMFLLFLSNPHAKTLSLKPSSEALLGMPPEERNAVNEWLVANGVIKKATQKDAGAYISKAPGDVVGKYAIGDVVRTEKLFELLLPKFDEGMRQAYDRERRLLPILMRNEREGMCVDAKRLEKDLSAYESALALADTWLRKKFKRPDLNLDAPDDVAAALDETGLVTDWVVTASGKKSTSKVNLTLDKIKDKKVAMALGYRNRLETVLANSMRPWLVQASANGCIFTKWNQVRQSKDEGGFAGTRTGRLSCSRFQNISKSFSDKGDGYEHPKHLKLPELPLVRRYIVPDKGGVFCHRDFSQQEPRIFAHFEDGDMCRAYNETPDLDFHSHVQQQIQVIVGKSLERRHVKTLNLGMMYGMGLGALAKKLDTDIETARELKRVQRAALPGIADLERETKYRGLSGNPVRTWGGRLIHCEPPAEINGVMRTFEYKLLNHLIQGSAADVTKEALIRYDERKKHGRFLVTVHDEINVSVPKSAVRSEMKILREAMSSVELSVPMVSDGKTGPSWGDLKKWEE